MNLVVRAEKGSATPVQHVLEVKHRRVSGTVKDRYIGRRNLRSHGRHLSVTPSALTQTESLSVQRRNILSAPVAIGVAAVFASLVIPGAAAAGKLRSLAWEKPCELTIVNELQGVVKVYWINYDGDAEFYGALNPGGAWSVQTFESHPWRFVDAASNSVVQDFVASAGSQVLRLSGADTVADVAVGFDNDEGFEGFDGVGGVVDEYSEAKVTQVSLNSSGGVASILVNGFPHTLDISIGPVEAMAMLYATGVELRRPSTVGTWTRTLKATGASVERVCITRLVSDVFYSRIVMCTPQGTRFSIDSRPSDSLSLALTLHVPIYVSQTIARVHEEVMKAVRGLESETGPSLHPNISEITKALPGAPQPFDLSFEGAHEA